MIFIFGFSPITKNIGPVEEKDCPHCNNTKHWLLAKTTYFISLFFIPLIPTSTKRFEYCPICNYSINLSSEEFKSKKDFAELNKEAIAKNMADSEYQEQLRKIKTFTRK